ncbi:MAG: hypothetical protein ACRDKV_10400 [Solirubrobacterales bacterium]
MRDQLDPEPQGSKPPPGAPPPTAPPPSDQAPPPSSLVDDADDLRKFHLNRLLRKPLTRILVSIFAIGAATAGAAIGGLAVALIAFGVALLISVVVVVLLADAASEDAFFDIYAQQRGMTRTEDGSLPPMTPLLRKGDERKADEVLRGPLEEGLDGTLALYTYTEVHHDKDGRHETDYHFTLSMVDLPESLELVHGLYCNRKSGFRFLEGVEDAFRRNERISLESEALDSDYEIFVSKRQDQNWIRQLFSPSFIVWLTDSAPDKFAFELEAGVLCCNVKGHRKHARQLDVMRETAAAVAHRIREEVAEAPAAPA